MRALAKHFEEDEDLWGLPGLLHDINFLKTKHDGPAQHGKLAANMLSGTPEAIKMAIAAHNGEYTGVIPFSKLDFTLRGGKIVTGMISAAALVRTEDVKGMQPNSLKKKNERQGLRRHRDRETSKECKKSNWNSTPFPPYPSWPWSMCRKELLTRFDLTGCYRHNPKYA